MYHTLCKIHRDDALYTTCMGMKGWMGSFPLDSQDSGGMRLALAAAVSVSQPSALASEDKDQRENHSSLLPPHNFTVNVRFPEQISSSAG